MLAIVLALLAPQAAAAQPAPAPSPASEKQICKRFTETGSLVRTVKVCKSAADWERDRAVLREQRPGAGTCNPTGIGGGC